MTIYGLHPLYSCVVSVVILSVNFTTKFLLFYAGSTLACFTSPGYCISQFREWTKANYLMYPTLNILSVFYGLKGPAGVRYCLKTSSLLLKLDRVTGFSLNFCMLENHKKKYKECTTTLPVDNGDHNM